VLSVDDSLKNIEKPTKETCEQVNIDITPLNYFKKY